VEWRLDRRLRVILEVIPAAAAVAAVVIVGVTMFQTFFGDANIYLPFARNTARVDFFSFNPHMFSSGATSPLWTLVLGIPFAVGLGVTGAKVFSLLMTAASVLVVIVVAYRVTGSLAAAGLASFYLVGAVAVWGVVMFDSPLVVILVALSIPIGQAVVDCLRSGRDLSPRLRLVLGGVWALELFARPDVTALVAIQAALLWLYGDAGKRGRRLAMLVMTAVIAAIPSLAYYSYSQVVLGTFSVAGRARAFTLLEAASHLGPVAYSTPMLGYFGSIAFAFVLTAVGVTRLWNDGSTRWLGVYIASGIVAYAIALTLVAPVTAFMSRYFVPTAPLIVVGIARYITAMRAEWSRRSPVLGGVAAAALLAATGFVSGSTLLVAVESAIVVGLALVIAALIFGRGLIRDYAAYSLLIVLVAGSYVPIRRYAIHDHTLGLTLALVLGLVATSLVVVARRVMADLRLRGDVARSVSAIALGLTALLLAGQLASAVADARAQSRFGYTFDQIEEREAIDYLNQVARPGDSVLGYEVQDRYLLRADVRLLSLDGLTDGIATPYLQAGDMQDFIRIEHPRFWIANDAIEYRPSLKRSFLFAVYETLKNDPSKTQVDSDGVTFRVLERRTSPWPKASTGWWRLILAIDVT